MAEESKKIKAGEKVEEETGSEMTKISCEIYVTIRGAYRFGAIDVRKWGYELSGKKYDDICDGMSNLKRKYSHNKKNSSLIFEIQMKNQCKMLCNLLKLCYNIKCWQNVIEFMKRTIFF